MASRANHSEETKAAVMAALLTGQSISHVASTYNIPEGTVKRWSAAAKGQLDPVRSEKRDRLGALLAEYLEAALITLIAQQEVFADAEYVRKQPASEAAVLHGVIADKAVRLLEALADNQDDADAV